MVVISDDQEESNLGVSKRYTAKCLLRSKSPNLLWYGLYADSIYGRSIQRHDQLLVPVQCTNIVRCILVGHDGCQFQSVLRRTRERSAAPYKDLVDAEKTGRSPARIWLNLAQGRQSLDVSRPITRARNRALW